MSNMQDQPHYKITPGQGWAKMQPVLDKAMPVAGPSRRFPLLWWAVSAMIITAAMGFFLFKGTTLSSEHSSLNDEKTTVPTPSVQNNPPEKTGMPTSQTSNSNNDANGPAPNPKAFPNTQENAGKILPAETNPKPQSSSPEKIMTAGRIVPLAMDKDEHIKSSAITVDDRGDGMPAMADYQISASLFVPEQDEVLPLRNAHVTESLSVSGQLAFEAQDYLMPDIPTSSVTKARRIPSVFEPNLVVSGLAGVHGGIGAYGGAGLNVNLNRRFSMTTSFGYFSYSPTASLLGGQKSLDASAFNNTLVNYSPGNPDEEVYVNAADVNNEAGYNDINALVDRVAQWQISAGVKWKVSPRFYTEGGVILGIHTKAFSTYPIVGYDPLSSPAVRISTSFNDFDIIRSTTTSLYAGIGYRIGNHFDVFTNWTHGLDQYLLNDSASSNSFQESTTRTDYIRGLSMGLRYSL